MNSFRARHSQTAKWLAGASWWYLEPMIGKPTHRPIWKRDLRAIKSAELLAAMERLWFACGTQPKGMKGGLSALVK
jgi:hypothetical protein